MDLLFKRYASPFLLIDSLIDGNRLLEFVNELIDLNNEEEIYNLWLHKVYDKSYLEFKEEVMQKSKIDNASDQDIEATIKDSYEILNNFAPEKR